MCKVVLRSRAPIFWIYLRELSGPRAEAPVTMESQIIPLDGGKRRSNAMYKHALKAPRE